VKTLQLSWINSTRNAKWTTPRPQKAITSKFPFTLCEITKTFPGIIPNYTGRLQEQTYSKRWFITDLCWLINPTISVPTKTKPCPFNSQPKTATTQTSWICLPAIACLIYSIAIPNSERPHLHNGRHCDQARGAWNWVSDRQSTSPITAPQPKSSCRAIWALVETSYLFMKLRDINLIHFRQCLICAQESICLQRFMLTSYTPPGLLSLRRIPSLSFSERRVILQRRRQSVPLYVYW